MNNHIEWCTCSTADYGDTGCSCPDVEIFKSLLNQGNTKGEAFKKMLSEEIKYIKKPGEVLRKSNLCI